MTDEAPKPDPGPDPQPPALPSSEVRKARLAGQRAMKSHPRVRNTDKTSVSDIIMGSFLITTVTGIVLAIAVPALCSGTRGARYSVRIEWERRTAEIDSIAEQARKDGKLPPAPEAKPRE